MHLWMAFVVGAVISWGAYGPALHAGRGGFADRATASMRALLCVGVAYFLVGVIVPLATLWSQGRLQGFNVRGVLFSTGAGILGALGAACIIWAFQNGGKPLYVMPLVFAGAPIVNALITIASHPGALKEVHPLLFVGMGLSAAGTWMVLRFLPA
jgi:hypothetical protein